MRRRNKSAKVPNVKLRPAFAPPSQRVPHNTSRDSGFDSEHDATQSFADVCPRPFRGVVLCATGISDKTTIFKQAIELGAQPLHNLTDKVTHLLALEPGSPKYKCALERKLPIMHPDWITDSHSIWLHGDDVNLEESVEAHRLPIFSDVVLCISGIDDVTQRTDINRLVTDGGGNYVKNIERPVRVTHLLCSTSLDDMSEKMLYATKFNQRKEASIRLVWEQWFWDCLKMGGRCDEDLYDISKPCPERQPTPEPPDQPESSSHVGEPAHTSANVLPDSVLQDDEELAVPKRHKATQELWGSILGSRGIACQDGKLVRSPSKFQAPPRVFPDLHDDSPTSKGKSKVVDEDDGEAPGGESQPPKARPSVLASFRRTQSFAFAPPSKDVSTQKQKQPFSRASTSVVPQTVGSIVAQGGEDLPVVSSSPSPSRKPVELEPRTTSEIFAGKAFRALGEAQCPAVRKAVKEAGGRVVSEQEDEDVEFVLVRLVSGSKLFRDELDVHERAKYRTECWLERCIFEERICPPDEHLSFTPIPVPTPVDGIEHISLSFSGLDESEACWIRRLARALDMKIAPNFSRRTTHLLCPSREGAKFDKAVEWGIPVVDMQWLRRIVHEGVVPSDRAEPEAGADERLPEPMADITNNEVINEEKSEYREVPTRPSSPLGDDDYTEPFGHPSLLIDPVPPLPHTAVANDDAVPLPEPESSSRQPSEPLSLAELRADMTNTTIRSSASPSPLKLPSRATTESPVKIDQKASTELKAKLSSLLGKRPSEEDDSVLPVVRQKRARPPKSKASMESFSRKNSRTSVSLEEGPIFTGDEDISMLVDAEESVRAQEQRVMYFDQAQNEERERLMKLLESQRQQEEWEVALGGSGGGEDGSGVVEKAATVVKRPSRRTGTRRSARVSGA